MKPLRALLAALAALAVFAALLLPRDALAIGTVKVEDTSPQEIDGRWKLKFTIDYGSIPHLAHMQMIFSFEQTSVTERSLTDQSPKNPIERRIPMQNQTPTNLDMDVGFSDASGKKFKITKFDFVIRRDKGFEAGEYTLTIKSEGKTVGSPLKLTLKGENPVIDRRAISFVGGGGDKKKDPPKEQPKEDPKPDAPKEDPPKGDGQQAGTGDGQPEPVKPKQGGCGCTVPGGSSPAGAAAALAGIALLARRRRRAA
jgi:MYXO-CTERM domain-containing protein